jgi:hypothetical protein
MTMARREVEVVTSNPDGSSKSFVASGILIGPRLVLTTSHILFPVCERRIFIRASDSAEDHECKLIWSGKGNQDQAAALIETIAAQATIGANSSPIRFGRISGSGLLPSEIIGYPA